jgi:hypothetical protein
MSMKSYYASSPLTASTSSTLPNPNSSKYFSSDPKQLLSVKSSSSKGANISSGTSYVTSLLPTSLFRPDSASAAVPSSSTRGNDENSSGVAVSNSSRPSSSGGLASQRLLASFTNSGKAGSYQTFPPTNPKSLFATTPSLSSSNLLGQQIQGLSSSPPVGVLLSRERRSSSCNDFREVLDNSSGNAVSRHSVSTGSASMNNPNGTSKKVRFSINLVSYTPHPPTHIIGSPLISGLKGGAAAHAAAGRTGASNNFLNGSSGPTLCGAGPNNGSSSPATQSPPTLAKDSNYGGTAGTSGYSKGRDNSVANGGYTDNSSDSNSAGSTDSTMNVAVGNLFDGSSRGRSSPLLQNPSNGLGSPKLVPVHMSPKPTQKKLLLEKQSSSLMSAGIAANSDVTDGSSASVPVSGATSSSSESPVAALIAKSVSVGNFISNNQTSVRFYNSRVEFSVATHPQLFDKAFISQATQALSCVILNYADMTGISIAGTKLRFKTPRKCTPFSNSFDADAALFQFAVDLNSVVSSSIVKQKVMPLICPVMFGGTK